MRGGRGAVKFAGMCGRFVLTAEKAALIRKFLLKHLPPRPDGADYGPRWNVAPGQPVLAVLAGGAPGPDELAAAEAGPPDWTAEHPAREARWLTWGIVPHWAKSPADAPRSINARSESVAAKPTFREAFRRRRVLVPTNGFYEWRSAGAGKQAYFIRFGGGDLAALAGVRERWRGPAGEVLETCAVLTTAANAEMREFHDRMPVFIPDHAHARWLETPPDEADRLADLLRPWPDGALRIDPVSSRVNAVRHDDPSLIETVAPPPSQLDLWG